MKSKLLLSAAILLSPLMMLSQSREVTGRIITAFGDPVKGHLF